MNSARVETPLLDLNTLTTKRVFPFTSEAVGEGHPDKVADQISDAVLDACLSVDPKSRVACEVVVKNNSVFVFGEITTTAELDYEKIVRRTVREIGYTDPALGFDAESCTIETLVNKQSPDISIGVTEGEGLHSEQGAGDQGLMFGYACKETPELMPLPFTLSHALMKRLSEKRRSGETFLKPDAKSQVTAFFNGLTPERLDKIVISTQHSEDITFKNLREYVVEEIIKPTLPKWLPTDGIEYLINPTGRFVIGGPVGDCGLTGRKIIVDTYGGAARHGGGAFSGKDPSKVDRSAAYAARHVAKNIVGAGLAEQCEIQVAYVIGVAKPVSLCVNTFGTATVAEERIVAAVNRVFDLTPRAIIESLGLLKPIYKATASHGHFGHVPTQEGHFSWERLDKVEALKGNI